MNRLFVVLATLLLTATLAPSANAVGDSAISVVASGTRDITPGSFPGCLGPTQISATWVYACTAGSFTFTFTEVTAENELTVNADGEMLVPGVAYTFSDFAGQMTIQRLPNSNDYVYVINGVGTITSA